MFSCRMLGMAFALTAVLAVVAATSSAQASVEISSKPTHNMNCTGGVCSPTAKKAVLNATDLANMLAASDVKVVTGAGAVTITVSSSFSWTSSHRLTLDANLNVSFRAPVVVAGQGAVTIVTNDGGSGGDLLFFPGGKLDFWDTGSNLVIGQKSYSLVSTIKALADAITANPNGQYALTSDQDASSDGTYRSSPIRAHIRGTVEGLGHTITNLKIRSHERKYVGLFRRVRAQGTLRDLAMMGANIISTAQFAGILVGRNDGDIRNSYTVGNITGGSATSGGYVSGFAGYNDGTASIINSSATASVNSVGKSTDAGGLVADNYGAIINSSASGDVAGSFAGGFASFNSGSITGCHADVSVSDTLGTPDGRVAGLVAMNYGSIANSVATGEVRAGDSDEHAGGLVGMNNGGTISNSFATGPVSGGEYIGGLTGQNYGDITNAYALGSVTGNGGAIVGGFIGWFGSGTVMFSYSIGAVEGGNPGYSGGLIGRVDFGQTTDGYWDIDTSGKTQSAGGVGLTDAQLKSALPAGFDPAIWGQSAGINNGYPYLLANPPPQ